jgi:hypothetical protein
VDENKAVLDDKWQQCGHKPKPTEENVRQEQLWQGFTLQLNLTYKTGALT